MSLVKKDKERQIVELALITSGIRLFNKECGKGGEGIDDCKFLNINFLDKREEFSSRFGKYIFGYSDLLVKNYLLKDIL